MSNHEEHEGHEENCLRIFDDGVIYPGFILSDLFSELIRVNSSSFVVNPNPPLSCYPV